MAATRKPAWRKDRISKEIDGDTGRHIVTLPTVKGMSTELRDLIFGFEASASGTTKAIIRMNKRQQGTDVPLTHKVNAALAVLAASKDGYSEAEVKTIRAFYA
jgi:hypothetical protein